MKTYIGIDNGVSGALAAAYPDGTWDVQPVPIIDCGRDKLLDVKGNLQFLEQAATKAGGIEEVVVIYEQPKKNPLFGTVGNYANGRNGEFWRVLLLLTGFSFGSADPQAWQKDLLSGLSGADTKAKAKAYIQRHFSSVPLGSFKAAEQEAIRDAMCIAAWARNNKR